MDENLITGSSGAIESSGIETSEPIQSTPSQNEGPVEIDNPDRYRYQGRPIKEWESGYMRQQDYTQKTTELSQERRYIDNLAVDLDRVKQNPALADQFRQIYPEKFHPYLRYVMSENQRTTQTSQSQQSPYAKLDPAYEQRIIQMESQFREREVAAIQADLDRKFEKLSQTYPFADEEAVIARAQTLLAKMKEFNPNAQNLKISDKQWDALWKDQNAKNERLAETRYKTRVQDQLSANKKLSNPSGKGGAALGHAPRNFRNIKEATAAALADIDSGVL